MGQYISYRYRKNAIFKVIKLYPRGFDEYKYTIL